MRPPFRSTNYYPRQSSRPWMGERPIQSWQDLESRSNNRQAEAAGRPKSSIVKVIRRGFVWTFLFYSSAKCAPPLKVRCSMFYKVMIALAVTAFVGGAFTSDAQARGDRNRQVEFSDTIGGASAFAGDLEALPHVSRGSRPGSLHVDLGVEGYGCVAHPDYGLYAPHFC